MAHYSLFSYSTGLCADRKQATPKAPVQPQVSLSAPLKELALRVPDLISTAGHSEIWGVRLSSPETHVPTQIVLQKYLNANDGDVAKAADQLQKTTVEPKTGGSALTRRPYFGTSLVQKELLVKASQGRSCLVKCVVPLNDGCHPHHKNTGNCL